MTTELEIGLYIFMLAGCSSPPFAATKTFIKGRHPVERDFFPLVKVDDSPRVYRPVGS